MGYETEIQEFWLFTRLSSLKPPKIESTGSGGGLKLFCAGVGVIPGIREYLVEFTSETAWGEEGYFDSE